MLMQRDMLAVGLLIPMGMDQAPGRVRRVAVMAVGEVTGVLLHMVLPRRRYLQGAVVREDMVMEEAGVE